MKNFIVALSLCLLPAAVFAETDEEVRDAAAVQFDAVGLKGGSAASAVSATPLGARPGIALTAKQARKQSTVVAPKLSCGKDDYVKGFLRFIGLGALSLAGIALAASWAGSALFGYSFLPLLKFTTLFFGVSGLFGVGVALLTDERNKPLEKLGAMLGKLFKKN